MIIHNINDLIKYGIHVYGCSSIPGIGTIKINRIPASYAIDRKKLTSPTSTLSYYTQEFKEYSILRYAEDCGISSDQVKLWSEELFRSLTEKANSIIIPDVGSLSYSSAGITFVSDNGINWNVYSKWPDIEIIPLSNPKRSYEFAVAQPKELTYAWKQKQNNTSTLLFPGIIVLLVLLFLVIKTCLPDSSKSDKPLPTKNKYVTESKIIESDTLDAIDQSSENQSVDSPVLKKNSDSNEIIKAPKVSSSVKSPEVINCTYIVGAFLKNKNAERLHNSLRKKGYETVLLKHDSFMRVGIVIPCNNDPGVPENIIRNFPDIWLLEE